MKPCGKSDANPAARYELRFPSLFEGGRDFVFPCDADGHINIGSLSERSRNNYYYARTLIGREFAVPAVGIVE